MEFKQLQYFIAVVEEGSVSAASRRVLIAQPALTRQIRLLEESLETTLFTRQARGMQLTVAGKALYEEAQELLNRRDQIKARLSSLSKGLTGKLSLGVTVTHLWVPFVAQLLGHYRDRYPNVAFEVFPLLSGPQLERLKEGRLDAGILYLSSEQQQGLSTRLLQRDHLILAVPATSPWASSPPDRLSQLNDEDFVWGFRRASPGYYDRVKAHFQANDFHPKIVQYGADNIAILSMVAAGLGITIVPAAASAHPAPGIRFIRLEQLDSCEMPLWLAWREDNESPALLNMVELIDIQS
tara:strand:- start:17625 stop:18512 length:888 start_codon:yes stop_codon:yes gene_type:complete